MDSRWRKNVLSPDLRYDTLTHMQKSAGGAYWEIEVPNGFYPVRVVGGDPTAVDSTFQYDIEGVLTTTYVPVAPAYWADFTTNTAISDGRLTVRFGPSAANIKINFIDTYLEIPTLPAFVTHPQNVMSEEYHAASLAATITSGTAPFTFLWYKAGDPNPIGTTGPALTYPHVLSGSAGTYRLVVTNYAGSITSSPAMLTVVPDVTPPTIVSVYSLNGLSIGVCFSEEMDDSAMAVTDNFTYSINDGLVGANPPVLLRPDRKSVILNLNSQISGPFTLEVLPMSDLAGNPLIQVVHSNTVAGWFAGDVGSPALPGLHFSCDGQDIEIVGGGADIWGAADQGYLINKPVSGDFDAKVRVTDLRGANAITKAVLRARESNNADARSLHLSLNPSPPGRDLVQAGLRATTTGPTVAWSGNFFPAGVPNAWMRLMRFGDEFRGYRSTNDVDWVLLGATNQVYPADAFVGIGVTAHDNTLLATGTLSGLTISAAVGPASVNPAFTAGIPTESGLAYDVKYKNALTDPVWTFLATINGDGTVKTYADPGPVSPTSARFYKVFFH